MFLIDGLNAICRRLLAMIGDPAENGGHSTNPLVAAGLIETHRKARAS